MSQLYLDGVHVLEKYLAFNQNVSLCGSQQISRIREDLSQWRQIHFEIGSGWGCAPPVTVTYYK